MLNHNSATEREETPHSTNSTQKKSSNRKQTISADVKRRAESLVKNKSIDPQSRVAIRYGLEINDPWLPELVRCVEAGESITDAISRLADSSDD